MRASGLGVVLACWAVAACGQFSQYTAPGSLAVAQSGAKDRMEAALAKTRWRLGPLRLSPWFAVRDVMLVTDVLGAGTAGSDFTATLGAGLHGYIPIGSRLIFGAYALPEYVYWRHLKDRNIVNGRYGFALAGEVGRLGVEAVAFDARAQQYVSSELEQLSNVHNQSGTLTVELRLVGRLSLFARGSESRWRYRKQDFPGSLGERLLLLDRDEKQGGGGLRYRWSDKLFLAASAESLDVRFPNPQQNRSSSGSSTVAELGLEGRRLRTSLSVSWVKLEANQGSVFTASDGTYGRGQVGWQLTRGSELQLYAGRAISYPYAYQSPYSEDERWGVAISSRVGWRGTGRLFWESGRNAYAATATGGAAHTEDVNAWGAALTVSLGRSLHLLVQGSQSEYDAGGSIGKRSTTRVQATVGLTEAAAEWW